MCALRDVMPIKKRRPGRRRRLFTCKRETSDVKLALYIRCLPELLDKSKHFFPLNLDLTICLSVAIKQKKSLPLNHPPTHWVIFEKYLGEKKKEYLSKKKINEPLILKKCASYTISQHVLRAREGNLNNESGSAAFGMGWWRRW